MQFKRVRIIQQSEKRKNMFKYLYTKWLKHFRFDKWWELHCYDMYCKNCKMKAENGCFIDYLTGKCVDR